MPRKKSFQNAIKWAYTGNWGNTGLSALFTFILAGILGPRDFGMLAICVVYITFLQMFLDQGLAAALIQREEIEQEHLDAVFWLDLALGVMLVLLSLACSRKWAAANHSPEIARIIPVLSLSIILEALSVVQTALLRREMDFRSLALRTNIAVSSGGLVGVAMALSGFRVWSLVGQQVVRDSTALILLWKLSPWRPRIEFSWRHLKGLMGFSVPNFTAQLGIFAGNQADSVVLGLFFGPIAVGLYRLAARLVNSVVVVATSSIQAVSLPEFSRLQADPPELRKSVLTCIRLSSAVTLPALAGLATASPALMATVGPKWTPASGVLSILSALAMFVVFSYFTGPLLQALGRPRHLAALEWTRTVLGIAVLVIAGLLVRNSSVAGQISGIAAARFAMGVLFVTPVFIYLLIRLSGVRLREILATIAPSALSGLAVAACVTALGFSGWQPHGRPLGLLITEVALGGTVGIFVLLAVDTELRRSVQGLLLRTLGRATSRASATALGTSGAASAEERATKPLSTGDGDRDLRKPAALRAARES